MYDHFLNHSPIDGHLSYLQFGGNMCKAAMNVCVQVCVYVCNMPLFLWNKCHRVYLFIVWWLNVIFIAILQI